MHWYSPCKPYLAGYWLLSECSTNNKIEQLQFCFFEFVKKLLVFFFNQWVMTYVTNAAQFQSRCMLSLCGMNFKLCLAVFFQRVTSMKITLSQVHLYIYRSFQVLNGISSKASIPFVTGLFVALNMMNESFFLALIVLLP